MFFAHDMTSYALFSRYSYPFMKTSVHIVHPCFLCMLECNIDARGQAARLITGISAVAFGLVLAAFTLLGVLPSTLGWIAVSGSIFGGAFAIFEARTAWCVVRAMGFKPRL